MIDGIKLYKFLTECYPNINRRILTNLVNTMIGLDNVKDNPITKMKFSKNTPNRIIEVLYWRDNAMDYWVHYHEIKT